MFWGASTRGAQAPTRQACRGSGAPTVAFSLADGSLADGFGRGPRRLRDGESRSNRLRVLPGMECRGTGSGGTEGAASNEPSSDGLLARVGAPVGTHVGALVGTPADARFLEPPPLGVSKLRSDLGFFTRCFVPSEVR